MKAIINLANNNKVDTMKQIIKWWKKLGNGEKISHCAQYYPFKSYKELTNEEIKTIYEIEIES